MKKTPNISLKEIEKYSREIAEKFHPEQIILFGSHAYGEATPDSDVDLLVVMEFVGRPVDKSYEIRRSTKSPFPLDLLVRRPSDLQRRIELGDFFLKEIMERGKVLL
ncbi:TPA: hypothetical protein DIT45_00200 [Candidatus Acetothermia bacterium]|nr:hypothetical protein [Candidatus Acetothermia bacterium]